MTEDKKVAVNPEPQKSGSGKKPVSSTGPQGVLQRSSIEPKAKNSHFYLLISFFIVFLIPSIICVSYYSFVASDRYAAGAGFVVRGLKNSGPSDLISSFTGLTSAGSTTSDSYVIKKFIESPDLVRELDEELDLRAHYSNPSIDWVSRFNNQLSFEEFVEYWKWRSTTTYDSSTGIVSFEVQAFDPQTGNPTTSYDIGGQIESARNDLLVKTYGVQLRNKFSPTQNSDIEFGFKIERQSIKDLTNEWKLLDSLGYSTPRTYIENSANLDASDLDLAYHIKGNNKLNANRYSAYLQYSKRVSRREFKSCGCNIW